MKQLSVPNLSEDDFLLDRLEEQIHRFEQLLETRFHGEGAAVEQNGVSNDALSTASRSLFTADQTPQRKGSNR